MFFSPPPVSTGRQLLSLDELFELPELDLVLGVSISPQIGRAHV